MSLGSFQFCKRNKKRTSEVSKKTTTHYCFSIKAFQQNTSAVIYAELKGSVLLAIWETSDMYESTAAQRHSAEMHL